MTVTGSTSSDQNGTFPCTAGYTTSAGNMISLSFTLADTTGWSGTANLSGTSSGSSLTGTYTGQTTTCSGGSLTANVNADWASTYMYGGAEGPSVYGGSDDEYSGASMTAKITGVTPNPMFGNTVGSLSGTATVVDSTGNGGTAGDPCSNKGVVTFAFTFSG